MLLLLTALVAQPADLDWEYVYASGDTRRIRPAAAVVVKRDNGLDKIIARIKRENKIGAR